MLLPDCTTKCQFQVKLLLCISEFQAPAPAAAQNPWLAWFSTEIADHCDSSKPGVLKPPTRGNPCKGVIPPWMQIILFAFDADFRRSLAVPNFNRPLWARSCTTF